MLASRQSVLTLSKARDGAPIYAAILAFGLGLAWLSAERPTLMPVWGPWEFSWAIYLAATLTLFWYLRGLARSSSQSRPALWRRIAFLAGLALIYAVLQTRFEYLSQHMFFYNRIQHVVMHHIGPLLVALGCSAETLKAGMPAWLRQLAQSRPASTFMRIVQQPLLAAFLFVGLFYFWLIPPVHFRAMIDLRLYGLMNWTMVLDGILFWSLVLDPRPKPPARVSFAVRAALAIGVMFPQIILGAGIALSNRDLYPSYALCGRLYPSISPVADQHIGGIIIWIPPAMMSVLALLLVINALRLSEETTGKQRR